MTYVNIGKKHPDVYQQMIELNTRAADAATAAGLPIRLIELVKIRASQLNGCAFCLKMHTREAMENGETWERLAVLPGWRESQSFTDQERAALHLAEEITLIAEQQRDLDSGRDPRDHFDAAQLSAVTWLAIVINAWNRIALSSGYPA